MKLEIQGLSKVGMVRTNNEDMISLGGVLLRDDALSFPIQLDDESQFHLLVADGMGGKIFSGPCTFFLYSFGVHPMILLNCREKYRLSEKNIDFTFYIR